MLYAYCVVDELAPLAELPTGLAGKTIKPIHGSGLVALVSDFEGDSVGLVRENVLKHDEVVRSVLERTTPLPFRFGTLANETQVGNFLDTREGALKTKLDDVRDCVEMSVKVIWDPPVIETESQVSRDESGQGAAFLNAKRREILGDEARVAAAKELNSWLHGRINQFIRKEEAALRPAQKLVVTASHLVEKGQITSYQEAIRTAVRERRDLRFLTSGPWAPYSFVNIDLEFKTHFGVS